MRKKILVVHVWDRASSIISEALDEAAFELVFLSGFSGVVTSVLEFKPALVLFEIVYLEKELENLLSGLMNLTSGRTTRKIIPGRSRIAALWTFTSGVFARKLKSTHRTPVG
jgi:hypothetical protein